MWLAADERRSTLMENKWLTRVYQRSSAAKNRSSFRRKLRPGAFLAILLVLGSGTGFSLWSSAGASFRFEILGDRTGGAQPGVFERVLLEAARDHPDFLLSVGDCIEGENDQTAAAEWRQFDQLLTPLGRLPLFLTPGNHDIWSPASERLWIARSGHPVHYGFDFRQAHFTILDNSRAADSASARFSDDEMRFLERDLAAHAGQDVKFVVSHRPTWLFAILLGDSNNPFHQLLRKYGVQYVLAGHIHQILHFELDHIAYLDVPSAGGHLRDTKAYERGWFFGHTLATVEGSQVRFRISELPAPYGQGRSTTPEDWGASGLVRQ
jgi:3',5'-cyclic AMP phosphodiesterase CpdA